MKQRCIVLLYTMLATLQSTPLFSESCFNCTKDSTYDYSFEKYIQSQENVSYEDYMDADDNSVPSRDIISICDTILVRGRDFAPSFRPAVSDNTLFVRLNLIFIQKDDGTGNFQATDEEQQQLLDDAIIDLNHIYANLVMPDSTCYNGPANEFISNAKIQFVDNRYYIRSSRFWNNRYKELGGPRLRPSTYNWYLTAIDDSIIADTNIPRGINIFFTEDSVVYEKYWVEQNLNDTSDFTGTGDASSQFPITSNLHRTSRIHMLDLYSKYWHTKYIVPLKESFHYAPWNPTAYGWMLRTISHGLAHEIGHSFNLFHLENDSSPYPSSSCGASIMRRSMNPRNFLPLNEIGRMYFNAMATNLRQFIDNGTYLGNKIFTDSLPPFPNTRFYHSITLNDGGVFSFPCDVTMPQNAYIHINNNAACVINGGNVHSVTNNDWKGIQVNSGGTLCLSNTEIQDYNIIVNNGGTIVVDGNISISGDHYIKVCDGACICIDEHATITLEDPFSVIYIAPNVSLGCSNMSNAHCIDAIGDIITSGNGKIAAYNDINYIQNETINTDTLVTGSSVMAGYNVTNQKPVGNVIVNSDGHLRIQATGDVVLTRDVEVQQGGELEIQ